MIDSAVSSAPYRHDSSLSVQIFFPRDPLPRQTLPRRARSRRPRRIALLVRDARLVARVRDPSCGRLTGSARVRVLRYDARGQIEVGGGVRRRLLVHGFGLGALPPEAGLVVERERPRDRSIGPKNGQALVESTRSRTAHEESLSRGRKGRSCVVGFLSVPARCKSFGSVFLPIVTPSCKQSFERLARAEMTKAASAADDQRRPRTATRNPADLVRSNLLAGEAILARGCSPLQSTAYRLQT